MDIAVLNLNDLQLFVAAVEAGGFAAASRRLGIPKSTVSKRVAELEGALGTRLIQRTSRSFVLTELGRDFHEHARAALIEAEAAEALVRTRQREPSGRVRISAAVPTAQLLLAPHLPRLAQTYPKLQLAVDASDRFVDVVQEGFDIAVRSHIAPLPDSGLVQRRVMTEPFVLVAAPEYLARRGVPRTPADLAGHEALIGDLADAMWRLRDGRGGDVQITLQPRLAANESAVLVQAAVAGLGIACLPPICAAAYAPGRLMRVLPDWHAGTITTTLVMPHRRGQLPAVRATVEFLVACLTGTDAAPGIAHAPS